MVPKITSNQQNSQPFYSVTSLEILSLGQIPFFSFHYTSAAPLKLMALFGCKREQGKHFCVQVAFYQPKNLANYYYLFTGMLVFCKP